MHSDWNCGRRACNLTLDKNWVSPTWFRYMLPHGDFLSISFLLYHVSHYIPVTSDIREKMPVSIEGKWKWDMKLSLVAILWNDVRFSIRTELTEMNESRMGRQRVSSVSCINQPKQKQHQQQQLKKNNNNNNNISNNKNNKTKPYKLRLCILFWSIGVCEPSI